MGRIGQRARWKSSWSRSAGLGSGSRRHGSVRRLLSSQRPTKAPVSGPHTTRTPAAPGASPTTSDVKRRGWVNPSNSPISKRTTTAGPRYEAATPPSCADPPIEFSASSPRLSGGPAVPARSAVRSNSASVRQAVAMKPASGPVAAERCRRRSAVGGFVVLDDAEHGFALADRRARCGRQQQRLLQRRTAAAATATTTDPPLRPLHRRHVGFGDGEHAVHLVERDQRRSWTRMPTSWPPIWPNRSRAGRSPDPRSHPPRRDPFHVVRVANRCVDQVRRRVQDETLGHLGLRVVVSPTTNCLALAGSPPKESVRDVYLAERTCTGARAPVGQGDRRLCPPTRSRRSAALAQPCKSWRSEILAHRDTGAIQ